MIPNFLDYILAVKVVDGVEEATNHIEAHSTHHSDAIVTENSETAAYFTKQVDSATVYVNASTRFTDGGQFGLGCEMGISTRKTPCAWTDGTTGNDQLQVYCHWKWSSEVRNESCIYRSWKHGG